MFKFVQRHSKLVLNLSVFENVEVKYAQISHFKYTKRSYHIFNSQKRFAFHTPNANDNDKYATNQICFRKQPHLLAAGLYKYSTAPSNIPDAPEIPIHVPTTEEIATQALNALGEPTFKSIGLGGWSPIGMVQNAFEYFHVTFDMPWWGCIVAGTIIVRLIVFPLVIMAQRNNALMNNHMPQIQHLQKKMTEARLSGNALETARYSQEFFHFMKEKGLNPLKNTAPMLLQMPFFISFFMGLRRMANCPVESMREGGLYWFSDLTVVDPYYILPVLTSLTMWITIEVGTDQMKTSNQTGMFVKYFLRAIPVVMLPFTINFPAAILCYWLSTNIISLGQVGLLKVPRVREYFKIPKTIKFNPQDTPEKKKGVVTSFRDSISNMKITRELAERQRTDEMIFNKSGRGPIVKTYKFDPTKHLSDVSAKGKTS